MVKIGIPRYLFPRCPDLLVFFGELIISGGVVPFQSRHYYLHIANLIEIARVGKINPPGYPRVKRRRSLQFRELLERPKLLRLFATKLYTPHCYCPACIMHNEKPVVEWKKATMFAKQPPVYSSREDTKKGPRGPSLPVVVGRGGGVSLRCMAQKDGNEGRLFCGSFD